MERRLLRTRRRTHHDGEQRAQGVEERPVQIVRHGVADRVTEREQEYLPDDPERCAKDDVGDWPPVVERTQDEDELCDDVDDDAGEVEDELEDPEARGGRFREAGGILECADRDQADDETDDSRAALQELTMQT